jgi:hypothetical protein
VLPFNNVFSNKGIFIKLLICLLSLLTLTSPSAFAGKLKGKIAQTSDNRMESQILPVNKKEVRAFYNAARLNPTASMFVSIDIDNDGAPESYLFRPGKDDDCNFTGRDDDCDGLVASTADVKSIAETLVNRIGEPRSGLSTGKRMQVISSESQTSISAYNGTISISKVEEIIVDKKDQYVVEYETFTIKFKNPSFDFKEYLRKGWDGSIKGVTSTSVQKGWDGTVKGSKISISIRSGNTVLGSIDLQSISGPGRLEECSSAYVCNEKLDLVLNLIR